MLDALFQRQLQSGPTAVFFISSQRLSQLCKRMQQTVGFGVPAPSQRCRHRLFDTGWQTGVQFSSPGREVNKHATGVRRITFARQQSA